MRVLYIVPSHLKILIPVGTAVIIVADVKFQYSISRFNNTYTHKLCMVWV